MTIQRIPFTSFDKILDEYADKNIPVIIEGAMENSGLFKWTPSLLRQRCSGNPVSVYYSKTGNFKLDSEVLYTTFGEYVDNKLMDKRFNIQQAPIAEIFPDLLSDIPLHNFIEKDYPYNAYMWFSGAKNNTTPLHFDRYNNFFIQCYGSKKFMLFKSEHTDYLYPHENSDEVHVSQVDITNPDLERFPLFEKAEAIEVTVQAGEVLFMPTGLWHQVTGLSTSISLNIWFDPFDFQATLPSYSIMFSSEYAHLFAEMTALVPFKYSDPLSFCGQFLAKGMHYEACICHIALLEYAVNELISLGQYAGGNLENSISLCNQITTDMLSSATVAEIVETFKFGQEQLKINKLNCTIEQALAVCDSAKKLTKQLLGPSN
jgi:hypothetical protein